MTPGSSPLARGLPLLPVIQQLAPRIIPARAGFTITSRYRSGGSWDHPRSRGVYPFAHMATNNAHGSSPLARGLHHRTGSASWRTGIIPARAGFTAGMISSRRSRADHPRSRGVYVGKTYTIGGITGSSPLARGLLAYNEAEKRERGIIPARAGFTAEKAPTYGEFGDHPRSRGVYVTRSTGMPRNSGSSPLARGLHNFGQRSMVTARIIPARAGFTNSTFPRRRWRTDHPRSRGVYRSTIRREPRHRGSSPLARGLRLRIPARNSIQGIIPARAGFTKSSPCSPGGTWDHPRSRGVYRCRT